MATFAIVRQDGEVDLAEGASVADVAARYGWPGNGDIAAYTPALHDKGLRHTFTSPEDQREKLIDKPKRHDGNAPKTPDAPVDKTGAPAFTQKGDK